MSSETENKADILRWQILQLRLYEHHIERIFELFHSHKIEPILIKGWAAARYYPNPAHRFSSDVDLAVSSADFNRAEQIVKVYPFNIDLHRELRHLDKLEWEELFRRSELVELGRTKVRVLSQEDHLRVLCVHWLTDGGANKEKLWDIFYAIENRPDEFDWDRFLNAVGEKRRRWFVCVVGLAQKYLGLSLVDTPLENSAMNLPGWLVKTVEKEWKSEVKLRPLQNMLDDKSKFWQQIKKRIPPNPIQATVELEGDFDDKPRFFYQIGNVFTRVLPSMQRITKVITKRNK